MAEITRQNFPRRIVSAGGLCYTGNIRKKERYSFYVLLGAAGVMVPTVTQSAREGLFIAHGGTIRRIYE